MIDSCIRPLDESDRRLLRDDLNSSLVQNRRVLLFAIISCLLVLVAGLPWAVKFAHRHPQLAYVGFGVALVYILFVLFLYLEHSASNRRLISGLNDALAADQARVVRCQANAMVQVADADDRTPAYYFQIEPNKILWLRRREYLQAGAFPNSDFEIVEFLGRRGSVVTSRIRCYGEELKPMRVIEGERSVRLPGGPGDFADFDVIDGSLDAVDGSVAAN